MIVTQIRRRRRGCCSNLVLRRAPRPHDMKLRQHGLRSWPCWLPNAGNHPPVKTARKGTPHEKSSSPRESCFFRGLDWRGVSMLHRAAIPPVTHSAASCLAPGDLLVLHLKIDIFCHLSIFFLTSAERGESAAFYPVPFPPPTGSPRESAPRRCGTALPHPTGSLPVPDGA